MRVLGGGEGEGEEALAIGDLRGYICLTVQAMSFAVRDESKACIFYVAGSSCILSMLYSHFRKLNETTQPKDSGIRIRRISII